MSARGATSKPVSGAVLLGGDRDVLDLVAAVVGGQQRLRAGLGPLHRLAQLLRDQRRRASPRAARRSCRRSRRRRPGRSPAAWPRAGPASRPSCVRRMCGICVADQIVICSPVGSTTQERGSMNAGISRCWRKRRRTTTESGSASAAAMASSTLPAGARGAGVEHPGGVLVGAQVRVHERGALGERRLHVEHGRRGRRSRPRRVQRRPGPRRRCARRRPPRPHRRSARCSTASSGRCGAFMSGVIGQAQGRPTPSTPRSAAV